MPNNTPAPLHYYPRLSNLITLDSLPSSLDFVKTLAQSIFSRIYYKNYQGSISPLGESAFYSLSIVSKTRLEFDLIYGLKFVLNRDHEDNTISSFPVTVRYNWPVIAYLSRFDLDSFSFEPQEIFNIALVCLNVSEETVVNEAINVFVNGTGDPVHQFVDDFNAELGTALSTPIPYPVTGNRIRELITSINKAYGDGAALAAFSLYILDKADLSKTKENIKKFFKRILPEDINEYIKNIIRPQALVTLETSASVEFPRNILLPWKEETVNGEVVLMPDPDDNKKTSFDFAKAVFYADTDAGIGYNLDLAGTLDPKYSEIAKTGLLIQIERLKLDLSKKKNIPEADAMGYPPDFVGVYADALSVTLPPKWFSKESTYQSTLRLGGYNLLVGTGGVTGTFALEAVPVSSGAGQVTSFFNNNFSFTYPITGYKILNDEMIQEVPIGNYDELLAYVNALPDKNQYRFKFPLQVNENGGAAKTIESQDKFREYINSFYSGNNDYMWLNLGKDADKSWKIGFKKFDISFFHGKVTSSHLHAQLELPKFTRQDNPNGLARIDVYGEWESKENFKLSAAFLPSGWKMNLFNFLDFHLQNIEVGKKNDNFFIGADTKITFPPGSFGAKMLKDGIDLPAMRFYGNGKFELAGGNTVIPVNLSLDIGPITMSVTAVHFGTIQRMKNGVMRSYNYIGFDGGINVNPLGLDVRGNGVKFYYTNDNDEHGGSGDSYFHISTLEIDLVIPGSASASAAMAIIKGALTIPEPGVSTEYRGKISVQLPKMNMYGSAEMAFDPKYPGFYIDASVELPVAIPLGSFGIFGFRGLLGYRYIAHKKAIGMTDDDSWYDFYVHPERGIHMDKFIGPQYTKEFSAPFSVGVGASLATLDGRLASLRAMVLLSLPSMFAIDAGLTIISERLGLTEDDPRVPPFYAFVIVGNNSLEIGAGGNFQLNKKDGSFIDIKAEVQMGFFFKNQKPWYVNFGTKDKPITASLFKDSVNIRAQAYLMIAAKGIEAGARVDFNLNLFIVKVWAAIEVGGKVSFERPQTGGYIYVEGGAEINLFIISVSLFISIYFRVELIKPFLILAELKFELKVKILFIKIKLKVHLTLKWEKNPDTDTSGIPPITYESDSPDIDYPKEARLENAVKGVHMLTNEEFILKPLPVNVVPDPAAIKDKLPYIPLDTYVDIKIEKGMIPVAAVDKKIGGHTTGANGYLDLIPPEKNQPGGHVIRQVQHKYSIEDVIINIVNEQGAWEEYNPYRAVVTEEELPNLPNINNFKIGFWQKNNEKYDTIRILASTPFSFMDGGQPGWFIPEQYGITASTLFCTEHTETWHESNVLDKTVGTVYHQPLMYPNEYINGAYYNILGTASDNDYMSVSNISNPHNFARSLKIENGNGMVILLPQASAQVRLWLTTTAVNLRVRYYKDVFSNSIYQQYELITEVVKSKAELAADLLAYKSDDYGGQYVSKIEIIPQNQNQAEIDSINAQIEQLWLDAASNSSGEVSTIFLNRFQREVYKSLMATLSKLRSRGCTSSLCSELDFDILHTQDNYQGTGWPGTVNLSDSTVINNYTEYQAQFNAVTGQDGPYVDFNTHSVIFLYVPFQDPSVLHNTTIGKISAGSSRLEICYVDDLPKRRTDKAVIIKVNKTQDKPIKLSFTPDCGCNGKEDPCHRKDELCNFLTQLMYDLNTCLLYNGSSDDLRWHWKCFEIFIGSILRFEEGHPQYELVGGYGYIINELKELEEYGHLEGATVTGAMQIVKKIYDIIYQLGDCGCNDSGETAVNCFTLMHQVSWLTAQDHEYQQTIPSQPAVVQDSQLMMEAMEKVIQPIWRPNSVYCVNLKLKDEVNGDTPHIYDYYFGFKTAGPIGHFEKRNIKYLELIKDENGVPLDPEQRKKPEEYPITSLKSYIDMKRSYPNADGSLLMSKPIFYGNRECEIRLFFTKPYVYNMLKTWDKIEPGLKKLKGNINIVIKDPVTDVIVPYPLPQDWTMHETVPEGEESWLPDDPNLPLSIQQMFNYVNHINQNPGSMVCSLQLGDPVKPKSYSYSVVLTNLNPEKLYTAIVYNAFDEDGNGSIADQLNDKGEIIYEENQKVHEFTFKTSRYMNFREQVESYRLKDFDDTNVLVDEKDAVYKINVNLSEQSLNDAYTLVSGGTENAYLKNLVETYSEVFDRAFEGVLGIKPLDPPSATEFVKIVNAEKDVVAILVRNPEPFNDPKIPLTEVANTFEILKADGINADDSFKVLYSKDYSQMLIMNKNKKITNEKIRCRFRYKAWNGTAYTEQSEVITNDIQLINN